MNEIKNCLNRALSAIADAKKAVKRVKNDASNDSSGPAYTNARKAERELENAENQINSALRELR
jgi:hypothetical protein